MSTTALFSHIRGVLFDLDGTLLDSAPDLGAAANALRMARKLPALPQSDYRPFVGTGARGMLRIALGTQPEQADFEQQREEFFQAYEGCMGQHSSLFKGVEALTQRLHAQGLAWGIVTNKSERFTLPITAANPTLSQAQALVCGDTTAHAKPHPEPLLEAARRLRLEPHQCIYMGDDERDIQAARAAGMGSVAAIYGYLGGDANGVPSWNADASVQQPLDVLALLGLQ